MRCAGIFDLHSRRQLRFNKVLLQLLMDELKLPECLLTVQNTIVDGHSDVVDLQNKTELIH